jgi:hypothetical protein
MSLSLAEYAEAKGLPIPFLESLGIHEMGRRNGVKIAIPYRGADGAEIAVRFRSAMKDGFSWPKGTKPTLYGLDRLDRARKAGHVVIAEGESDVQTLWLFDVEAVGVPGAAGWKEDYATLLDDIEIVYVINEKDAAAGKLVDKLKASPLKQRLRVVTLDGAKDPSELYHDVLKDDSAAFRVALGSALAAAVPAVPLFQGGKRQKLSPRETVARMIEELEKHDEEGAKRIVAAALDLELTDAIKATLHTSFAKAFGVGLSDVRKLWTVWEDAARSAGFSTDEAKAERARFKREEAEQAARDAAEEKRRLEESARPIAKDLKLLEKMAGIAGRLGVVGERSEIKATYIAISSRLLRDEAICLVRLGAPSVGKNFLVSKVLSLIPRNSVIQMSSGSPLSLVYYGGNDEDALAHKALYIPEAAIIAERAGEEKLITVLLRLLISEGHIDHKVSVKNGDRYVTEHIVRNGPVAVILTTARDNIEDELKTRLMPSDADETVRQTQAVMKAALALERRSPGKEVVEQWVNYQLWLEAGAPYDVTIPFSEAIFAAFEARWADMAKRREKVLILVRMRRDLHGFLAAVKTSAVLHKAQRDTDSEGRIVATLADYGHAHDAFDASLARLYRVRTPETALAVVRAIEDMGATAEFGVKVTVRGLMAQLGISSIGVAAERLRDVVDRGFVEVINLISGYGQTSARSYRIIKSSKEVGAQIAREVAAGGHGVFPTRAEVAAAFAAQNTRQPPWNNRTTGTTDPEAADGTDCSIVPEGYDKDFSDGGDDARSPFINDGGEEQ